MSHAAFYEPYNQEPFTILGERLLPLSIGHLILLHQQRSCFVTDELRATPSELAFAIFICSRTFEASLEAFSDPTFAKQISKWSTKINKRLKAEEWTERFKLFQGYMDFGLRQVTAKPTGLGTDIPVDAPSFLVVKVWLMNNTSLTETEILNRPYAACNVEYLIGKACDGQVMLIQDDDLKGAKDRANAFKAKFGDQLQAMWQQKKDAAKAKEEALKAKPPIKKGEPPCQD